MQEKDVKNNCSEDEASFDAHGESARFYEQIVYKVLTLLAAKVMDRFDILADQVWVQTIKREFSKLQEIEKRNDCFLLHMSKALLSIVSVSSFKVEMFSRSTKLP